jgi:hypothetical protein
MSHTISAILRIAVRHRRKYETPCCVAAALPSKPSDCIALAPCCVSAAVPSEPTAMALRFRRRAVRAHRAGTLLRRHGCSRAVGNFLFCTLLLPSLLQSENCYLVSQDENFLLV